MDKIWVHERPKKRDKCQFMCVRVSRNGNGEMDEDDFREGGEPASMEKTARINVSERVQLHTQSTFLPHTIIPKRNSHDD